MVLIVNIGAMVQKCDCTLILGDGHQSISRDERNPVFLISHYGMDDHKQCLDPT